MSKHWMLLMSSAVAAAALTTEERLAALEQTMQSLHAQNQDLHGQVSSLTSERIHIPVDVYIHKHIHTTFECTVYHEDQRAAVEEMCRWSSNPSQEVYDMYVGDSLRILNGFEYYDRFNQFFRLPDKAAFDNCDFSNAEQLFLQSDFDVLGATPASVKMTAAGHFYYGSAQKNLDGTYNTDDCTLGNKRIQVKVVDAGDADKTNCPTALASGDAPRGGYVPITRYVKRRNTDSEHPCMGRTNASYIDWSCRWGMNTEVDMTAYTGDYLAFYRSMLWSDYRQGVWRMDDEAAFDSCDFTRAHEIVTDAEMDVLEAAGERFTLKLDQPGVYYFSAERPGMEGNYYHSDLRRQWCWDAATMGLFTQARGAMADRDSSFGEGVRLRVTVVDPPAAVLTPCPEAAKEEHAQADSVTVQKMKGVLGAVGRQLIEMQVQQEERVRNYGNSGVSMVRSQAQGTGAYFQETFVGQGGPASAHNHANFKYTIGLGEFTAALNGVHFTTRHNDFDFRAADASLSAEEFKAAFPPASALIGHPDVPAAVTSKGSVAEQVAEMKEWFRAFHMQNVTHRDYRPYFKANLCYLEAAWTETQDGVTEPFASARHTIDADSWGDMNEKINYLFNSGLKSRLENLPFLPTSFRAMMGKGAEFEPRTAQWFYRIQCQPLEREVPTARFRVARDFATQMGRVGPPQTQEELAATDSARFEVNPWPEADWAEDDTWPTGRFSYDYMDELMAGVAGFDGPNAFLEDTSFGGTMKDGKWGGGTEVLNTARYSRWYSMGADAMGRSQQKRGFNDNLWAAQTTHTKVSPSYACEGWNWDELNMYGSQADKDRYNLCYAETGMASCNAHAWEGADVDGGAKAAKCVWTAEKMCKYKKCWETRWSYAIPLEVVYTTPLNKWNPYNLQYHEAGTAGWNEVTNGRDGSAGAPFRGNRYSSYFQTPAAFFKERTGVDSADTSGGRTYVEDAGGQAHEVMASGFYINMPEIEGVGVVRQRYPVMPIHEEGNTIWKEAKALQEAVLGQEENLKIKGLLKEARALEYGVDLYVYHSSHSHTVHVSSQEFRQLVTGKKQVLEKAAWGSDHSHYIGVSYSSKNVGNEWKLHWCTSWANFEACPASVWQSGTCGPFGPSNVWCCPDKCTDEGVLLW